MNNVYWEIAKVNTLAIFFYERFKNVLTFCINL